VQHSVRLVGEHDLGIQRHENIHHFGPARELGGALHPALDYEEPWVLGHLVNYARNLPEIIGLGAFARINDRSATRITR
jgi:hypothetical protein